MLSFSTKNDLYFGNSHVVFTLATEKVSILGEYSVKNVGKVLGIPMASSEGVHLL